MAHCLRTRKRDDINTLSLQSRDHRDIWLLRTSRLVSGHLSHGCANNLAPSHGEIQPIVHAGGSKLVDQAFDHDRRLVGMAFVITRLGPNIHARRLDFRGQRSLFVHRLVLIVQPHPISVKNTAKNASSTITAKIAETTAIVVRLPTSSEFPSTRMP